MSDKTTYLFARPSFVRGVARLFDFGGSLQRYNFSKSPEEADKKALQKDWEAVGEDLYKAMLTYEQQQRTRKP